MMKTSEHQLDDELIHQPEGLKYVYRAVTCDRTSRMQDFRSDHDHVWHSTSGSNMPFASSRDTEFDKPELDRAA